MTEQAHPAVEAVRRGYDALSHRYRADDAEAGQYGPWVAELVSRTRPGGDVLDLGCGCGVPVARALVDAGLSVTGVDVSDVQIERARRLVPGAGFVRADATALEREEASLDAIVCLYTLIHLPLDAQPSLISRMARWLRPGGWLLATTGWQEWTGSDDAWLGGTARMWWSQADAATYHRWIGEAGLRVTAQEFVPEGDSGHALFWARKP
ncbi:class I SAM-dependent methyltransferase [Nonomuraea longicatena]|uniref:Class I SAM-dependent methyltransferase n=1 Tax=Nonomuraea longicatena TaxID=83682 RepID=A0ABP4AQ70_9ACTN